MIETTNQTNLPEKFERDGFVIVENFFDDDYMAEIDCELEKYVFDIVPTLSAERVFREADGAGAIKSLSRMNEESEFFARFKTNSKIVEFVAALFAVAPEEIVAENMHYFGKPAFEGSITPWHQDNGFQQYAPPESLMIWLALRNVDEEMGCVVFAEGSHKLGVVPHVPSGVLGFSQTVRDAPDLRKFPEVKATMRRGGLSLHHCDTLHRSGANKTNRPRPALSVNYRTVRAVPDLEARARVKVELARLLVEKGAAQMI